MSVFRLIKGDLETVIAFCTGTFYIQLAWEANSRGHPVLDKSSCPPARMEKNFGERETED